MDVEDIPEPMAPKNRENKKKNKSREVPEKPKKKFRTISLAKKKGDEKITEMSILPENEAGICVLH